MTAIDELIREHEQAIALIGEVRAAYRLRDLPRMAESARRIAAVLAPHTEVQERGLFPALAAAFPDRIGELEEEHRRIEAVLAEAEYGTPADPGWPGRFLLALVLLREHIVKEQDGLFPAATAILGPADWDAVDAVRARCGTAAGRRPVRR
ncbi:hemerythrin domain-containing protein [Peterkaempfera bronchialis]|uniref:hemerythrin domain-containing protein n=1 Tax=Peterkaempfera bronchialis TaxID=2126346 RepID=UPI003C2FD528